MRYVLADVNVWLATLVREHPHHVSAVDWWRDVLLPAGDRIVFCRITQLGLLRLLCNEQAMGPQRRTVAAAWSIYQDLLSLPAVVFAPEPEGTEERLAEYCRVGGESGRIWTDAFLAAFARAGGLALATFDRGYRRFGDLELVLLD
jgi:toxin-antitoxin system PIN domain toxin